MHKEFRQHICAFFFQDAFCDLHLMIERIHLQQVEHGTGTSGFRAHASDHNAVDPRLHKCPGAHLAGFQRHIECAPFQPPVPDNPARLADGSDLRMTQGVFVRVSTVVSARDDPAVSYNDAADRNFSERIGLLRLSDRFAHVLFIFR